MDMLTSTYTQTSPPNINICTEKYTLAYRNVQTQIHIDTLLIVLEHKCCIN